MRSKSGSGGDHRFCGRGWKNGYSDSEAAQRAAPELLVKCPQDVIESQKSIMIAAEPALSGEFPAGKKVGSGGL